MIRVFGWQTSTAAEHDFRIGMPFPLLSTKTFAVDVGTPGTGGVDEDDLFGYDVVFAHRLAGHVPLWHKLCADPNVLTVYDMDDDLLCVDVENIVPYRLFHPLQAETRRNVETADIVTVPNETLAERYRQINPNVVVLPICIPDDLPDRPIPERDLSVGWAGSTHKAQDWQAADMTAQWRRLADLTGARFVTMGGDYTRGALGHRHRHVPFTADIGGYYRALDFAVGVNPLMASRFNDGKSHTKLIEYGARGIPTLASAIGQNTEWVDHGTNGFLVHDNADWVAYLLALCDDDTRARMGAAARESARRWTISRHIHRWESVFRGMVS